MKTYAPAYYPQFRCIADRCKHSCCVGWEIDIDRETYQKYRTITGSLGERLRQNISVIDGVASFVHSFDRRCPFLNPTGLCDLILQGGEDLLCEICDQHPRFYQWYHHRTEVGVGLCCEAAAKLILEYPDPAKLMVWKEDAISPTEPDMDTVWMLEDRDTVLSMLQDRSLPIESRIDAVLAEFAILKPTDTPKDWFEILMNLERLDPTWTDELQNLQRNAWAELSDAPVAAEQLLCYFIYRHFPLGLMSEDFGGCLLFAVISTRIIFTLAAAADCGITTETLAETARRYSAEIEYSDDNLEMLLELLTEQANDVADKEEI